MDGHGEEAGGRVQHDRAGRGGVQARGGDRDCSQEGGRGEDGGGHGRGEGEVRRRDWCGEIRPVDAG